MCVGSGDSDDPLDAPILCHGITWWDLCMEFNLGSPTLVDRRDGGGWGLPAACDHHDAPGPFKFPLGCLPPSRSG